MSEGRLSIAPRRILMFKGYSAGIGDLLYASAAWRVLHDAWPAATLHLLFLTRDPGAPSEELIAHHHLLQSFATVDKRTRTLADWRRFLREIRAAADRVRPDLIIDLEPNGLRSSLLTAWLGWRYQAKTAGIATQPGRGWFYHYASVSRQRFARERGLRFPLEFTHRDFVALSALGLERAGRPIELRETEAGRAFRLALRARNGLPDTARLLGVNIGCGPPTVGKRPDYHLVSGLVAGLQREHGFAVVLTGAPNEQAINEAFLRIHQSPGSPPVIDLAGQTSLLELVGAINACELFLSSDSGPFHMAVALGVPTLGIFNWDNWPHYHHDRWVRCRVAPSPAALPALREAARELLALNRRDPAPADTPGG